jgi:glycosyltransferase involved in cell wall biosynthesis
MVVISLVTLGAPEQLTGGYLYHRRMADAAADHDARIDFVPARLFHSALAANCDAILVDSIAAARVAPWTWRRSSRTPLAAILHQPPGGIDRRPGPRAVQAALDRSLYRRCQLLIAASDALGEELITDHGLPRDRLVVIPPGRDVAPAPSVVPDLRHGRNIAVLNVGNWVERKGTLQLLDAFARLPEDDATLHLAGRHDVQPRYAARVQARLSAPELSARVVDHGPVSREDVARLYAGADAFVLPSYREPYGTVYGEALAAGLPCLGWRCGNLPNLVDDGREGVILEPGDIAGLSAALHRLATDGSWRAQLTAAARARGSRLPTWNDSATQFFDVLARLAHGA